MTTTVPTRPASSDAPSRLRRTGRWLATFPGYPLGAVLAGAVAGPIDSTGSALVGGLVSGAVLGGAQAWGKRADRSMSAGWVAATAVGMSVGLAVGSGMVDHRTTIGALAAQGAVNGAVVGLAQAIVLRKRLGALAAAWPVLLSGLWAAAWAITTSIGVEVDERFTVFGSSGAVVVALVTSVLPHTLSNKEHQS